MQFMERILTVFTGGTISCRAGSAVMGATAEVPGGLLRRYPDDATTIADCVR